jgi:hypothetical protein
MGNALQDFGGDANHLAGPKLPPGAPLPGYLFEPVGQVVNEFVW